MALISLPRSQLGFGGPLLLEKSTCKSNAGEWVGLLGRNGMGKSHLLKLVNGDHRARSAWWPQQNLRVA